MGKIVEVLDGELIAVRIEIEGRVWVHSIDLQRSESQIAAGEAVAVGNRVDAQRQALELGGGVAGCIERHAARAEILVLAAEGDASVVVSRSTATSRVG